MTVLLSSESLFDLSCFQFLYFVGLTSPHIEELPVEVASEYLENGIAMLLEALLLDFGSSEVHDAGKASLPERLFEGGL